MLRKKIPLIFSLLCGVIVVLSPDWNSKLLAENYYGELIRYYLKDTEVARNFFPETGLIETQASVYKKDKYDNNGFYRVTNLEVHIHDTNGNVLLGKNTQLSFYALNFFGMSSNPHFELFALDDVNGDLLKDYGLKLRDRHSTIEYVIDGFTGQELSSSLTYRDDYTVVVEAFQINSTKNSVEYDLLLTNNTDKEQQVFVSQIVNLPEGSQESLGRKKVDVPPYETILYNRVVKLNKNYPAGNYVIDVGARTAGTTETSLFKYFINK